MGKSYITNITIKTVHSRLNRQVCVCVFNTSMLQIFECFFALDLAFHILKIYIYDPGSRFATTPPPHMVWSQNLRFAAFRMKTLYLQCFLHGGLLVRSATLQIRWIFATNLPKTCYLQCFGFYIVE